MKVLVYGTLKKGHGNSLLLEGSKFIKSDLFEIDNCSLRADETSWFPYLFKSDVTSKFVGELYEIDDKTLRSLDNLEGHPTFYTREFIDKYDCHVYVFTHDDAEDLDIITDFTKV